MLHSDVTAVILSIVLTVLGLSIVAWMLWDSFKRRGRGKSATKRLAVALLSGFGLLAASLMLQVVPVTASTGADCDYLPMTDVFDSRGDPNQSYLADTALAKKGNDSCMARGGAMLGLSCVCLIASPVVYFSVRRREGRGRTGRSTAASARQ